MQSVLVAFVGMLAMVAAGPSESKGSPGPAASTKPVSERAKAKPAKDRFAGISVLAPDAFYVPPKGLPSRPGVLLRSEPLANRTLPSGMKGWRILYSTTVNDRTPATAVATVFAPSAHSAGPLPVIDWLHGTTGLMQKCMPSLVSAPTLGIPAQKEIAQHGWAVVATDYSFTERGGPHPYLIGEGEARAGLDAVRAARQIPGLKLDERTVVWGHSQGGHSALWTGIVGHQYAPDVNIVGVAAIAPAADILRIMELSPSVDKRLGPYIARAYSRFYPDVRFEEAIRPGAQKAARQIVNLCGFLPPEDPKRIAALTATFKGGALALDTNSALRARLTENIADKPITAPLLVAQGGADQVVSPRATDEWVKSRCAVGQQSQHWTVAGRDHGGIVQPGSPLGAPLAAWTADRFAGRAPSPACTARNF